MPPTPRRLHHGVRQLDAVRLGERHALRVLDRSGLFGADSYRTLHREPLSALGPNMLPSHRCTKVLHLVVTPTS